MDIKIIVILLLILFELSRNFVLLRRNRIGLRLFLIWIVIWASMLVFLIWPSLVKEIQALTGFEATGNLLFTGGIMALYLLVHGAHVRSHRLERQNRLLIRELAFLNYRLDNRGTSPRSASGEPPLPPG